MSSDFNVGPRILHKICKLEDTYPKSFL